MAKTGSTKALAKVPSNPGSIQKMEDWEIELAETAKDEVATEQLGVPRITHKGGILKLDGERAKDNKVPLVVLTYGLMKTFYSKGYDPKAEGQTPDCYAFAPAKPGEEEKMAPHTASPDKQNPDCASCQHNRFGTAEMGNGKRCRDQRRVLCIVGAEDADSIVKAQVRQFEVPPGSLRAWGNYLKGLKEFTASGSIRAVVTELSAEASESGAHSLTFKAIDKLAKEQSQAFRVKEKQVEPDLFTPFPNIKKDDKPAAKGKVKKVKGQD